MKFLLVVYLLLSQIYCYTNATQVDSLKNLLSKSGTTKIERVNLLNEIAKQLIIVSTSEAESYAWQSLKLASEIKASFGIGSAYSTLGKIFSIKSSYDSALIYFNYSLIVFQTLKDSAKLASNFNDIGIVYYQKGDYRNAFDFLKRSYELRLSSGSKSEIAANLINLGVVNKAMDSYASALDYYLKALRISNEISNKKLAAVCNNNIGLIYVELKEFGKASSYYSHSLEYYRRTNEKNYMASSLFNIGMLFLETDKPDSALGYFKESLIIANEINSLEAISDAMLGLGSANSKLKYYKEAESYFNKAMNLAEEIDNKKNIVLVYQNLSENYFNQQQFQKSLNAIMKSAKLIVELNDNELRLKNYSLLFQTHSKLGNYENAFTYHLLYTKLLDSVFTKERLEELKIRYETEGKEKEIELLKKDKYLVELERDRQSTVIGLFVAGSALLALIISFAVYRVRSKTKINKKISEINQQLEIQNVQLEEQSKKLRELDQLKSQFFSNISHEFRTPLTLIIGPLKKLISETQSPSVLSQYQIMLKHSQRLNQLINQLLDLSKLEKGGLKLQTQLSDLNKFVKNVLSSFESLVKERGINLLFAEEEKNIQLYFDQDKLHKIISNLLSNALKFTERGGSVKLSVSTVEAKFNNALKNFAEIVVADTGIGISETFLPHIFDRFYQIDSSKTRSYDGTGIGLALVKELVELHKGEINVNSEEGKGSEFKILLPLGTEHLSPNEIVSELEEVETKDELDSQPVSNGILKDEEQKTAEDKIQLKSKSIILVVEDNSDMRQYICDNISDQHLTSVAVNGIDGFQKAAEEIPDLIISDVMMPMMDGIELCRKIKTDERTSHIPLILLTARTEEESKLIGLETGADDYLSKPFSVRELNIRINNLISLRKKLRDKFSKNINIELSEIAVTSLDDRFLKKVFDIIESNIDNFDFTPNFLYKEIGMSQPNFYRKLKALTGQSPTHFIRSIRLKRAAFLLKNNAGNVSEISLQVGFNSFSFFSKCFKEQFGVTPSNYQ